MIDIRQQIRIITLPEMFLETVDANGGYHI